MKNRMVLSALALALAGVGCESMGWKSDDDKKEQSVTIDQLPPAARATLMKEAGNGRIEEIDKQIRRGRTVYEADVLVEGKKWEIAVREDGQFLKKELDEEDDAEDERED